MMLTEFKILSEETQLDLLFQNGVYIGKRKLKGKAILLYQLDSFYAEIFYKKYRVYIEKIRFSATTEILDPYLQQINVAHLVE